MKKIYVLWLIVFFLFPAVVIGNQAVQVGSKVKVDMALLADRDSTREMMKILSPELIYSGGEIKYKRNFIYPGSSGPEMINTVLGVFISKESVPYKIRTAVINTTVNDNDYLTLFNPNGEADISADTNQALKDILTPGSRIQMGFYLDNQGAAEPTQSEIFFMKNFNTASQAWTDIGSGIDTNIGLVGPQGQNSYNTLLAEVSFIVPASIAGGKNKLTW